VSLVALEIPKVGLVMENARLVRWLKQVGEAVRQGEPLLELETEKSVVEIEAAESGRLVEILLQPDQEVHVGDRVGWLENDLAAPVAAPTGQGSAPAATAADKPDGTAGAKRAVAGATAAGTTSTAAASGTASPAGTRVTAPPPTTGRIKSSPVARRLAAQYALDLRYVQATGPRGRIQLADVRRAIESKDARGPSPSAVPLAPQPLTSMRRAVARSMTLSNATVPQFFVERSVDWTNLQTARARLLKDLPESAPRPSVNDFILQAIARSLLALPQLNATFTGDANSPDAAIIPARGTHIGLVVAVENGLLVPVLHDIDRIGMAELARRRSETVQRALSGRLKREELEGATISLSNLGAKGPDRFTAIISPPQSAILAVGRQRDSVVAVGGGIHVKPMSQLTLTVDHRVADGRLAADFLASLTDILEGDAWRLT
jgi:pyruvate dehydrogenase E2 component (dihydrolipoamide acetyltransferase)